MNYWAILLFPRSAVEVSLQMASRYRYFLIIVWNFCSCSHASNQTQTGFVMHAFFYEFFWFFFLVKFLLNFNFILHCGFALYVLYFIYSVLYVLCIFILWKAELINLCKGRVMIASTKPHSSNFCRHFSSKSTSGHLFHSHFLQGHFFSGLYSQA